MSERQPEALRLADALEMSSNHGIRREAAAELRRLHAQIAACEPYLKEGETPAERIERDHLDSLALMTLLAREKTKNEALPPSRQQRRTTMNDLRTAVEKALFVLNTEVLATHACDKIKKILRAALAEHAHAPGCALLQIPSGDCDCDGLAEPTGKDDLQVAEPEAEPVAWQYVWPNGDCFTTTTEAAVRNYAQGVRGGLLPEHCGYVRALYPAPPRREWVGLTDEEIANSWPTNFHLPSSQHGKLIRFARAIERALKEKNT